jgi:DNA-directed RNA polymerase sigma subunit (sigma70/sigma32)
MMSSENSNQAGGVVMNTARSILDDPGFYHFQNMARRHPPLDHRQESELLMRLQNQDKTAIDALVDANLHHVIDLAMQVADRWRQRPIMDLVAEGTVALVSSVRRYDSDRHGSFRPYILVNIRRAVAGCVQEACADQSAGDEA